MRYAQAISVLTFAAAAGLAPIPGQAASNVDIQLNFGPPPPRYEVVPAPRAGYVWTPGYWDYDRHQHTWRGGHWERERHGQHWVNGGWEERDGRWHLHRGHWEAG